MSLFYVLYGNGLFEDIYLNKSGMKAPVFLWTPKTEWNKPILHMPIKTNHNVSASVMPCRASVKWMWSHNTKLVSVSRKTHLSQQCFPSPFEMAVCVNCFASVIQILTAVMEISGHSEITHGEERQVSRRTAPLTLQCILNKCKHSRINPKLRICYILRRHWLHFFQIIHSSGE